MAAHPCTKCTHGTGSQVCAKFFSDLMLYQNKKSQICSTSGVRPWHKFQKPAPKIRRQIPAPVFRADARLLTSLTAFGAQSHASAQKTGMSRALRVHSTCSIEAPILTYISVCPMRMDQNEYHKHGSIITSLPKDPTYHLLLSTMDTQ